MSNKENTGNRNTGDFNTGDYNTGYWNTGDYNTGDFNTGHGNIGDFNTGSWNTGEYNTGDWNTGDYNTGSWNTGQRNTGNFNTGSWDEYRCFDKKYGRVQWEGAEKPGFIFCVDPTDTGGDMKAAWAKAYADATDEDILLLSNLPNFDPDVFEKITGIDVRERLAKVKGGEE